jgi:hypothetical protein
MTKTTDALHEDVCTFMAISPSVLLIMKNVSGRLAEKIKIHIFCSIILFRKFFRLRHVEKHSTA